MFGFGKTSPVAEHEAEGEIEEVYHQIRQTLRVTGINLVFRKWAANSGLLPVIWQAVQPNVETMAFEKAADQLRAEAARAAQSLGPLKALGDVSLGESPAYQVHAALELYHYINPKLLLLVALVQSALAGESADRSAPAAEATQRIERGIPPRMAAMEMEDEHPEDDRLQTIFSDIQETLGLESINSDYRTLALWPDYLAAAWTKMKPLIQRSEYEQAAGSLRNLARSLASGLPLPVMLNRDEIEAAGADFDQAIQSAQSFERLLPGLILNVAFCLQDFQSGDDLARSPFPATARRSLPGHSHH